MRVGAEGGIRLSVFSGLGLRSGVSGVGAEGSSRRLGARRPASSMGSSHSCSLPCTVPRPPHRGCVLPHPTPTGRSPLAQAPALAELLTPEAWHTCCSQTQALGCRTP